MDLDNMTVKEMKERFEKLDRLESSLKNYEEYSKTLLEISKSLSDLANKINPLLSLNKKPRAKHGRSKELVKELYEICKNGTQITAEFIEKTYNPENKWTVYNAMDNLRKMPHINCVKDGRSTRLFYDSNIKHSD